MKPTKRLFAVALPVAISFALPGTVGLGLAQAPLKTGVDATFAPHPMVKLGVCLQVRRALYGA